MVVVFGIWGMFLVLWGVFCARFLLGAFIDEKFDEDDEEDDQKTVKNTNRAEGARHQEHAGREGKNRGEHVVFDAKMLALKGEAVKELEDFSGEAKSDYVNCCKKY